MTVMVIVHLAPAFGTLFGHIFGILIMITLAQRWIALYIYGYNYTDPFILRPPIQSEKWSYNKICVADGLK